MPLKFPIRLNQSFGRTVSFSVFGIFLLGLSYFTFDTTHDVVIKVLGFITAFIGLFLFVGSVWVFVSGKPVIEITRYRISRFTLFAKGNQKHFDFKDIISMNLDYMVSKDHKTWHITIRQKNGKCEKIGVMQLNVQDNFGQTLSLNERQIFDLIEQVYQNPVPPTLHNIPMDINDRMTKSGQLMWVFMGGMLIFSLFMMWLKG